jgi:hypothetical protein
MRNGCRVITNESLNMPNEIHSYSELQQQIHDDLRLQHPDWVEPNGESPICDSYEARLTELLGSTQRASAVRLPEPSCLRDASDY